MHGRILFAVLPTTEEGTQGEVRGGTGGGKGRGGTRGEGEKGASILLYNNRPRATQK